MKTDELKAWGLTDEQSEKVMAQYGKDVSKLQKENEKMTADRDKEKERADTAEETLKKFDGVDVETMQAELATWQQKAKDAEKDYADKLAQRDFEDALKEEISGYKFTSEAAKEAIMARIRNAGLKVSDGKILGLSDLLAQIKEKDASAFVDEKQEQLEAGRAKPFTGPLNPNGGGAKKMTREEISGIKDTAARQRAIAENFSLFQ
ncbi:phage scaffolding protein [Phocaeicola sartorii]|uniref:phage scaffolding protein n=1 Tax=Phocaeicola sartorii TaxID=671267 RepID=UPI002729F74F|nr:phage scaffolding protein [Phocaeicola sartorii]